MIFILAIYGDYNGSGKTSPTSPPPMMQPAAPQSFFFDRAPRVLFYVALCLCAISVYKRLRGLYKRKLAKAQEDVPKTGRFLLGNHKAKFTDFLKKADDLFWSFCGKLWCVVITPVVCVTIYLQFELILPFYLMLSVFLVGAFLLVLIRYYSYAGLKNYIKEYEDEYTTILANANSDTLPMHKHLQHTFPAGRGPGSALPSHILDYMVPQRTIILSEQSLTSRRISELLVEVHTDYTSLTENFDEFFSLFYSS